MSYQRARSKEQIRERKDEIAAIALDIYDREGYSAVTFSAIARQSHLTRPAIYGYFRKTDDILVYALSKDFQAINADLAAQLAACSALDAEGFTEILHAVLMAHPRMLKMVSLHYAVMENGASDAALKAYKSDILKTIALLDAFIDRFFAPITPQKRLDFKFMFFSFVLSVYVLTHPSAKQMQAIKSNDPAFEFPGFEHLAHEGLKAVVATLEK